MSVTHFVVISGAKKQQNKTKKRTKFQMRWKGY